MADQATALRQPPPLPSTTQDLLSQRKLKARRTINDIVEDVIVRLWEDKTFSKLVDAVWDSNSVEGSTDIDDVMAAMYLRDYAKKQGIDELAESNLATIVHSMKVVMRRYGQGRNERRDMVGGAPTGGGGDTPPSAPV